jgi:hypothetical protein
VISSRGLQKKGFCALWNDWVFAPEHKKSEHGLTKNVLLQAYKNIPQP